MAPLLIGVNDAQPSPSVIDTLEGAYSAGAGSGVGRRIPILRYFHNNWSDTAGSFTSSHRTKALFDAGHQLIVSYKPPASYSTIINGSQDAIIDALATRIRDLPWGAAVSGSQPGQAYGGTKPTKIRISFHHEMDNDTSYGTADQFKQAYRRFMSRIVAIAGTRVICLPIFTGQANNNGAAARFYPGNTAADYCHELGIDPYFMGVASTKLITFAARLKPWQDWRDKYAPNRNIAVCETNRNDTIDNAVWYLGTIVAGMQDNPDVSCVCWFFYGGTSSAANLRKSMKPETWQAYVDLIDDAYGATPPPADTSPLSSPGGLSAPQVSETAVGLSWARATDPAAGGYQVSRNGVIVGTVGAAATSSFADSGLQPATSYAYRVKATPVAGSTRTPSPFSTALNVKTSQVAVFDPPQVTDVGPAVNGRDVTATATATDPASGTLTYTWDWGDGSDPDEGASATATHTYATAGTFTTKVTATSSVSGQSATKLTVVIVQEEDQDRTPLGFPQWPAGTKLSAVGRLAREGFALADSLITRFSERRVQAADADPVDRPPLTSYVNIDVTVEEPSDTYPDGRLILTALGEGGGGGLPSPGTITESMLAFDPATQPEMDTALVGKLPVGYHDPAKVDVGSVARNADSIKHGWVGRSFDAAHIANTGGTQPDPGQVYWTSFIAEVDASVTALWVVVASAGSGTGHTAKIHDSTGATVATATNATSRFTTTGPGALTFPSTPLTRGAEYHLAVWVPSGATGPALRTCWLQGAIVNIGLAAPNLRAAVVAAGTSPSTLPLASGTAATPMFVGAK